MFIKKLYEKLFLEHGRYKEEISSSSVGDEGKYEKSYFDIPKPKSEFIGYQDKLVITLTNGKLQRLIKKYNQDI